MGTYTVEIVELDLMNPESFQYQVFNEGKFIVGFATLAEANAFVVEHGGEEQLVLPFEKSWFATAGSEYR